MLKGNSWFFRLLLCALLFGYDFYNEERYNRENNTERQTNPDVLYKSRYNEHNEGDSRNGCSVRYLG